MRCLVVAAAIAGGVAVSSLSGACGHGGAPAASPDYPTLPPLSSTPIGLLIDQAASLELTRPQVDALDAIDRDLRGQEDVIDGDLHDLENPPQPHAASGADGDASGGGMRGGGMRGGGMRGGGMRGGGMRGGGMGGGGMGGGGARGGGGGGGGSGRPHVRPASPPPPSGDHAAEIATLRAQKRSDEQAALARALPLLDVGQQASARALLAQHGFAVPAPAAAAPPALAPAPDPDTTTTPEPAPPLQP